MPNSHVQQSLQAHQARHIFASSVLRVSSRVNDSTEICKLTPGLLVPNKRPRVPQLISAQILWFEQRTTFNNTHLGFDDSADPNGDSSFIAPRIRLFGTRSDLVVQVP